MTATTSLASLLEKLKVEEPYLPPRNWEPLHSESGRFPLPPPNRPSPSPSSSSSVSVIGKGENESALAKIRDCYPQLVQDEKSEVHRVSTDWSIRRSFEIWKSGVSKIHWFNCIPRHCRGLLCSSCLRTSTGIKCYFREESQREVMADAVNAVQNGHPNSTNDLNQ